MNAGARDLPEDVRSLLPLTPAVFFTLFALADGEKHGYAIMQEVGTLSGNKVRMGPGTLYSTIQRLLELELVEEVSGLGGDSRRRYYRLTPNGKLLLDAEILRMDDLVKLARRKRLSLRTVE
jgi:DNA-binding PadR family transcriptional regulator